MSGVIRNIDLPPPSPHGESALAGWRGGGGGSIVEDVRYCSVQYICKYFMLYRDGLREVVVERPFAGLSADHYTFAFDAGKRFANEKS
jgi:hypothetical protein